MNCPYCGFLYDNDVRFCPSCGNQITSGEAEFVSVDLNSQMQSPTPVPRAEMLKRQAEEKDVKKYTTLLVLSLFLALLLIAGAVYLVAFFSPEKKEETPVSSADTVVRSELVGSWVDGESYLVMTASGQFACDGVSGSYASDGEAIVFEGEKTVYAEYSISDGVLTLVKSRLGHESTHEFYFVTERTDLTYSELMEMHEGND